MKTPMFIFLGVVENGTNANLEELKDRLAFAFQDLSVSLTFEIRGELLAIAIDPPQFSFYITFANNDHQTVADWKEFARDFELPWDIKPVDESRLAATISYVEKRGWGEYRSALDLSYIILGTLKEFNHCQVFTIPSVGRLFNWRKFFI
jgi:hypothetical protein